MKVLVNYDFAQLLGESDEFELAGGTKLGELLRIIDTPYLNTGFFCGG